jgi:asparagine synthase (glutamine-hydrolysing)
VSGLAALIYKDDQKPIKAGDLTRLVNSIVYPDTGSIGSTSWKNIGLVIYDQFNSNADHFVYENDLLMVVCDAEVYNYRKLFSNSTESDFSEAEIIATLFTKHGQHWWQKINGPFSVFIWDKKEREGFAYTDRIGIKSIVYYEDSERIIVASRIRSISTLPSFKKELDRQAIFSYILMEMIPTPYTIYKNVKKLESGHCLHIKNNQVSPQMYWNMEYPPEKITDQKQIEDRTYQLTQSAIERRVNYRSSIEEVGAFLSGGTDSSTIAGFLQQLYPGQSKTFSIGFDESGYDEMYYARIAAKTFQTQHNEYYITPEDIIYCLPIIVDAYDEPFANSSVIPAYFCAKLAKENGLQILLGGDGGDEIFGGNARYHDNFANFAKFPRQLSRLFWMILKNIPEGLKISYVKKVYNYFKRSEAPIYEKIHAYALFHYISLNEIFSPEFLGNDDYILPQEISKKYTIQVNTEDPLDQFLYNDLKLTLMDNDLVKINRMTELANIIVRYPFLDHELVQFTGFIPPWLKVKEGELRYIFKESFKKLLPLEIIRKKKHGFGLPIVPWMLKPGKLHGMLRDYLFNSRINERGIFNYNFIKNFFEKSLNDKTTFYGSYLYFVLFLEMWLQKHLDS